MEEQDLASLKEKISLLLSEKKALLQSAGRVNSELRRASAIKGQLEVFIQSQKQSGSPNSPAAWKIRKERDRLEFKIATEAYTPKHERAFLDELSRLEARLSEAERQEWVARKLSAASSSVERAEKKKAELQIKLSQANSALDGLFSKLRVLEGRKRQEEGMKRRLEARKRQAKERKKAFQEENKEYLAKPEEFVTLEEICVVERKPKQG